MPPGWCGADADAVQPGPLTVVATHSGGRVSAGYIVSDPGLRRDPRWAGDAPAVQDGMSVVGVVEVGWHLMRMGDEARPAVEALHELSRRARTRTTAVGYLNYEVKRVHRLA